MQEEWRPVVGYNDYEVSSAGNIKRVKPGAGTQCKVLKYWIDTKGYPQVTLTKNGIQKKYSVHRLVAQSFIPNQEKKPCVNHIDSNRTNNKINNLEWCTYKENTAHSIKKGRFNGHLHGLPGENNGRSKIKLEDVLFIRSTKMPLKQAANLLKINYKYASKIKTGRSWKHVPIH